MKVTAFAMLLLSLLYPPTDSFLVPPAIALQQRAWTAAHASSGPFFQGLADRPNRIRMSELASDASSDPLDSYKLVRIFKVRHAFRSEHTDIPVGAVNFHLKYALEQECRTLGSVRFVGVTAGGIILETIGAPPFFPRSNIIFPTCR